MCACLSLVVLPLLINVCMPLTSGAAPYELTMRFGCELMRVILRDLGHCPIWLRHLWQWPRSRGINPDSHPIRVDNSGSATTVLPTKYLYNDAKRFFSERWVCFFLNCRPSLLFWSYATHLTQQPNQHQEKHSFGSTAMQGSNPMGLHILLSLNMGEFGDHTLVVPRLRPLPCQGIPHPKWTTPW